MAQKVSSSHRQTCLCCFCLATKEKSRKREKREKYAPKRSEKVQTEEGRKCNSIHTVMRKTGGGV